ncbi:MAG: ABC transporter ATP-binding protein [Candidatus Omnitrophica bacterium]|nr:ABC transporter ATP-binding protein [Candidatus Omnitrophota bacterium]
MTEKKILLSVENLSSGYGRKTVLKNINFQIKEGEFLGIIGPNGAGKSTLLRNILRILPSLKGKILFRDKDIRSISPRILAQEIAYVPQQTQVWFSFSVLEILKMGRYPFLKRYKVERKKDWEVIEAKVRLTGIENFISASIDELSLGEKQMVFITRALIQEPTLILLDEPTAHLDIGHEIKIFDLLDKLNRQKNITVISVLHDLNLASQYCNRLLLLSEGEMIRLGTPQEVLDYKLIEEVYDTVVVVKDNPVTKRPHIFTIPQKLR